MYSHKTISLDGNYELCYNKLHEGSYDEALNKDTIPCTVPGDVHVALTDAGIIDEPLNGLNSNNCKWVEENEFWYTKKFTVDAGFLQEKEVLTFDGLDLTADVWLNGNHLGQHNNAFLEATYDITTVLHEGENTLVVRIDNGLSAAKDKPLELMGTMWNNNQPYRAWMRKPAYVHGWDFTPWLPTCGIWKSVHIDSFGKNYIKNAYAYDVFGSEAVEDGDTITVNVQIELGNSENAKFTLKCSIYGDERFESTKKLVATATKNNAGTFELTIPKAYLWWPNLSGNPYLYEVSITLFDDNEELMDKITFNHGIRKVSIREEKLHDDETGFTFVINDVPIFVKGANHVPLDSLVGRVTDEKTEKLVELSRDCNMNMLRVWGGGVYEGETFFSKCDKEGIMVWHDFMFATGYYPDFDDEFMKSVEAEARYNLTRCRNHSSIIGWSGNSEAQDMYLLEKRKNGDLKWYGGKIYEELLPKCVDELTENTIYREGTPFSKRSELSSFTSGDQHMLELANRQKADSFTDLWKYTDFNAKFLSEFGIAGAMNLNSAKKCIDDLNPDGDQWLHHCNTLQERKLLSNMLNTYFGDYHKFTEKEYIIRSQLLQAELTRHSIDEFKRRKFECSGLLFWTLSDTFGANSWALIDYYLKPKAVYDYVRRANQPLSISFVGYECQNFNGFRNYNSYYANEPKDIKIWAQNDYNEDQRVKFEFYLMTFAGKVLRKIKKDITLTKNSSIELHSINLTEVAFEPETTLVYARFLEDDTIIHENRFLMAPFDKLQLEATTVSYVELPSEDEDDTVEITLKAKSFVLMFHMETEEDYVFSDNNFDIYVGKPRTFTCKAKNFDFKKVNYWAVNDVEVINPLDIND